MKKDTLRLLLGFNCNRACSYCCNEQEQFNSQFVYKTLDEANLQNYKRLCISGGEPFLYPEELKHVLFQAVFLGLEEIYIYSNGELITDVDLLMLSSVTMIGGTSITLNIGLHDLDQLDNIIEDVGTTFPARFSFQDKLAEKMFARYPDRLNLHNTKLWIMNECNMPNEDWVVLKEGGVN